MGRHNYSHPKQNFNMKSLIFLLGLIVLAKATAIEEPSEVEEFKEREFEEAGEVAEREFEEAGEVEEREFEEDGEVEEKEFEEAEEVEEKEFEEAGEVEEREFEEAGEFEEREFEERGVTNCHGFCNVVDLAKSAQISTSSTYSIGNKYSLKTLVDGCIGTKLTSKNVNTCCFHTKKSASEWVDFRFAKPKFVRGVVIYNRVDCCKERLFPLEVLVRDEKNKLRKCQGKSFKVGDPEIPSVNTNPIRIDCGAMLGTSVAIRVKNQMLNICEVKIFGF